MTKQERLLDALKNGQKLSVAQIRSRYRFECDGAVRSAVRNLRNEGYSINTEVRNRKYRYRLGKPSRQIIAAGYRVLGA